MKQKRPTYLDLINNFWKVRQGIQLGIAETALYFFLLNVANSLEWPDSFKYRGKKICDELEISRVWLWQCRNKLKQAGLIDFEAKNGGACVYKLLSCKVQLTSREERCSPQLTSDLTSQLTSQLTSSSFSHINIKDKDKDKDKDIIVDDDGAGARTRTRERRKQPLPTPQPPTHSEQEYFNQFFDPSQMDALNLLCRDLHAENPAIVNIQSVVCLAKEIMLQWQQEHKTHGNYSDFCRHLRSLLLIKNRDNAKVAQTSQPTNDYEQRLLRGEFDITPPPIDAF